MADERTRFQVLVVDDDIPFRDFLASSLMELGHEVMMVSLAKQALNLVRSIPFDLVIIDGVLPDGDGISLIEQIRASNPKTMLFFVSARAEFFTNAMIRRKLQEELKVEKLHKKPIDTSKFLLEVNALLSTRRKIEEFDALELVEVYEEEREEVEDGLMPVATSRSREFSTDDPGVQPISSPSSERIQEWVNSKRGEYARKLRETLMEMVQLCRHSSTWTSGSPTLARVHHLAHKLHGSAGVYGFPDVGQSCAQLEALLQEMIDGKNVASLSSKIDLCLEEAGRAYRDALYNHSLSH